MSNMLIFCLVLFSVSLFLLTFHNVRNGKIPVKYSMPWFLVSLIILILGIFPFILESIGQFIGIVTLSNLIISIILTLLLLITLLLTVIISKQKKLIKVLIQEVSIIKKEIKDLNDDYNS